MNLKIFVNYFVFGSVQYKLKFTTIETYQQGIIHTIFIYKTHQIIDSKPTELELSVEELKRCWQYKNLYKLVFRRVWFLDWYLCSNLVNYLLIYNGVIELLNYLNKVLY